jgi:hypothetical protein
VRIAFSVNRMSAVRANNGRSIAAQSANKALGEIAADSFATPLGRHPRIMS